MSGNSADIVIMPKANGERGAMGGYVPQYDEFACRAYDCILNESLVEIRVADAEDNVGKLDDICYVTTDYVHAYQIKWSNIDDTFKYLDFFELLPTLVDGWRKLCQLYPSKIVIPHLLTNRKCSSKDRSIKNKAGKIVGSFSDFVSEVLIQLKDDDTIEPKWNDIIQEVKTESTLTDEEWRNFWNVFVFTYDYQQEIVDIRNVSGDKRTEDLLALNRLIQQMASSRLKMVKKTIQEILKDLGWDCRLETIYNHSLYVMPSTYEPISTAIAKLDEQLSSKTKGYIFLEGSPGSGKSTVLTQWAEKIPNKHIRYYAFDFTNPSSHSNNDDHRGDETTFLFDMVRMIEKEGFKTSSKSLPFMEYNDLKHRFYDLLSVISKSYKETGQTTVLIIDGLDHITREYVNCTQTLIRTLPSLYEVPEGVVFVLGSQQYDSLPLEKSVLQLYKAGDSTIVMPAFSRDEIERLSMKVLQVDNIDPSMLDVLIDKSQGHPLYLRYLLALICEKGNEVLNEIPVYDGTIENYYESVLGEWLDDGDMKHFLGLLSRIIGSINTKFVQEWGQKEQLLINLRKKLHHLFLWDDNLKSISFFHNSFRQFLLEKTAVDVLNNEYSEEKNREYYKELAAFFHNSKIEPVWNEATYLYHAAEYDSFLKLVSPEQIQEHLREFRPVWHALRDVRNAVRLAAKRKDIYLLTRYMLYKSQLDQMSMQDYSALALTDELIQLGYVEEAKMQIREHKTLMCSQNNALQLARLFKQRKDIVEANILFELGYPEFLSRSVSEFHNHYNEIREHLKLLKEWVSTAVLFMDIEQVDNKIDGFISCLRAFAEYDEQQFDEDYSKVVLRREIILALIRDDRWKDMNRYVDTHFRDDVIMRFDSYYNALLRLLKTGNNELQSLYYNEIVEAFRLLPEDDKPFLRMAIVCMKTNHPIDEIKEYLDRVSWTSLGSFYLNGSDDKFNKILPHLRYLELRALCGFDDIVSELVVADAEDSDSTVMEDYARKLFCLAKIKGYARAKKATLKELMDLLSILLPFLDKVKNNYHNRFQYAISSQRKDLLEYLVSVASEFAIDGLAQVADLLKSHYQKSSCNIESDELRNAVLVLYHAGLDKTMCVPMLYDIETKMLEFQDLDGIASALFKQGKAWLEIGDCQRAELLFKRMIVESFGVGYRKDYQPTTFSEWIGTVNKIDSNNAISRIHWMTSRLKYIDNASESRVCIEAAIQLMTDAFELNLGLGCQLATWMLDNEYGYFESVSGIVINALLNAVKTEKEYRGVFYVYAHIHLAFLSSYDIDAHLLRKLCEVGRSICAGSFDWYEKELKRCIQTQSSENHQEALLKSLDDFLAETVDNQEEMQPRNSRPSKVLCAEAEELLSAGRKEEAWVKGIEAVEESDESGWVRYYDGGTRLDACKVLLHINPVKGREFTIHLLGEDICNVNCYFLMNYWDEILPLLSDDIDELKLFDEEESYMNRILRDNTIQSKDCPMLQFTGQGVTEILCSWMLYLSQMHVMCLAEKAKIVLSQMLAEGIVDASAWDESNDAILLELAMYVNVLNPSRLEDFRELARKSCLSPNYQHRIYARTILKQLGEEVPVSPKKKLSGIYSLTIPESKSFDFRQKRSLYDGYVDWNNPSSVMQVAAQIQGYLTYVTGYNKINIDTRAFQIMQNHGSIEEWNDSADKRVGQHYHNIVLSYPYCRPRAQVAIDSMMEVAAELLDSGIVYGKYDDSVFMTKDFTTIRIQEQVIPPFIQRIAARGTYTVEKGWENKCADSPRFLTPIEKYDDKYVIGEWTRIVKPDDNMPWEEYMMKISNDDEKPDAYRFFGDSPYQKPTSKYFEIGDNDANIIVVRNGYFVGQKMQHEWIAINSACAYAMGWHPAQDGLFAWDNAQGERMVESIFWQCGNTHYHGRSNYEASEGWLVLASHEAIETLRAFASMYVIQMVMRGNQDAFPEHNNNHYKITAMSKLKDYAQ